MRRMALVTSGCAGGATGCSAGSPGNSRGFRCRGWAPNAAFQSLAGGRDGSVWVGVEGAGLVRIREGQCVTFGAEQGLPATELVAVVEDDAGDLWLGGSQSVVRVNRASLEAVARRERERLECQVFDRQDGLPGPVRSGHQPACWKASDGRIWFATLRGIAVGTPKRCCRNCRRQRRRSPRSWWKASLGRVGKPPRGPCCCPPALVVATFAGLAQRPGKSAEVVQGNLSEIATTSKEMLENLRQLTRSLRPQLLDSLGLTRSLQTLLDQTARTDLRVESDLENVDALCPPPGNINLYRIVQEALANVLKHASATKVRVSLRADAALVRLSVADDGGGFAVAEPQDGSRGCVRAGYARHGRAGQAPGRFLARGIPAEHPTRNIQHGTSNTEHPTRNIQHGTSNTEHPTRNIQHGTANTEHPTPNIQHGTSNTEHPTPNIQHRTSNTEQPMITQLPALDVGCSMLGVRCSGPVLNMSRTPGLAACVPLR